MALSAAVKALALLVFLAALAGATYGVQQVLGDNVAGQLVSASLPHEALNATGGHAVTYVVVVQNRDAVARDTGVVLSGDGLEGRSQVRTVPASGNATFFVTLDVPADLAQGEHALRLTLVDAQGETLREREDAAVLAVLAPAPGYEPGDSVTTRWTGRIAATGRVFETNDPALLRANLDGTSTFRFSPNPFPSRGPQPLPGVQSGMEGMQAGESRTFTVPAAQAYGNATMEQRVPREESLPRLFTFTDDCSAEDEAEGRCSAISRVVGRAEIARYLESTGQGDNTTIQEGATFNLTQGPNVFVERISDVTDTDARITLVLEEGDAFTFYPYWPNGTVVTEANATHAVLTTTPTTSQDEGITMRAAWPEMTHVVEVTDTEIIVRHSPPVGYSYTSPGGIGQTPTQVTVSQVTEDEVVLSAPSNDPVAGQDVIFDVTLLTLAKT